MATNLSPGIIEGILDGLFDAAQAAGVPFCDYLKAARKEAVSGATTGAGRRIVSVSNAGQSVSYGDGDNDTIPQDQAIEVLAQAASLCPQCLGTDEEKLECLKVIITAPAPRYLVHHSSGLRGCGC